MPRHGPITDWEDRMRELRTNQGLVGKALNRPDTFKMLMGRYHKPVNAYLVGFLLRHQLVTHEAATKDAAANEAAKLIWDELLNTLPAKLAGEWQEGKVRFRELLHEGVHLALHSWSKPVTHAIITAGPEDDRAWKAQIRSWLLAKALEKLNAYQREHEGKGNLYGVIFRLWDVYREETLEQLDDRLAGLPGGRRLGPAAFRKALSRARDLFGKYLFEEVAAWLIERDLTGQEKLRKTFEEMNLFDDYALKSKSCRWSLGLEDEED